MQKSFEIGDKVIMKKTHACKTNLWEITRVGADVKIKCLHCNREVMLDRLEFMKKLKKVIDGEK